MRGEVAELGCEFDTWNRYVSNEALGMMDNTPTGWTAADDGDMEELFGFLGTCRG